VQGEDNAIYLAVCCEAQDVKATFEHELVHAIQLCDQVELELKYKFSSNECWDCILAELIAYVCAGQCTSLDNCKTRALRSCVKLVIANTMPPTDTVPPDPPRPGRPIAARDPCALAVPKDFKEKKPAAYKVRCTQEEMLKVMASENLRRIYDGLLKNGRDSDLCRELSNPDCVLNLPRIPDDSK
jgi:hypothetical protein